MYAVPYVISLLGEIKMYISIVFRVENVCMFICHY